jgi:uncharacterized protein YndB with AHSA1/START domain
MRPVSATVSIDAPRERVYDLLIDLSARPAFCDHFLVEYRLERLDPVGLGAAARFRLRHSGEWMDTVIEQAERPHLIREQGRGGRWNAIPTHTVWELAEGASPQSTELTATFWTEPAKLFERLREITGSSRYFRRDLQRALGRLRTIVEGAEPVQRVDVAGGDAVPAGVR